MNEFLYAINTFLSMHIFQVPNCGFRKIVPWDLNWYFNSCKCYSEHWQQEDLSGNWAHDCWTSVINWKNITNVVNRASPLGELQMGMWLMLLLSNSTKDWLITSFGCNTYRCKRFVTYLYYLENRMLMEISYTGHTWSHSWVRHFVSTNWRTVYTWVSPHIQKYMF